MSVHSTIDMPQHTARVSIAGYKDEYYMGSSYDTSIACIETYSDDKIDLRATCRCSDGMGRVGWHMTTHVIMTPTGHTERTFHALTSLGADHMDLDYHRPPHPYRPPALVGRPERPRPEGVRYQV
jgi:hypothetical protein